jgi:hypothetical protein
MSRKIIFVIHLTVSIFILIIAIALMVNDIFSVGKFSVGNYFLFTCPSCFAIPIAFLSGGYLLRKPRPRLFYLPILINLVTIIVGLFLYQFENSYPDFAFQQQYPRYEEVVKLVESDQLEVTDEGIVRLREKDSEMFQNNVVYSITNQGTKTIYFEEGYDNSDLFSWGYIYRSDGNQPSGEDKCSHWRNIVPTTPNWYYCDAHAFVGLPLNNKSK